MQLEKGFDFLFYSFLFGKQLTNCSRGNCGTRESQVCKKQMRNRQVPARLNDTSGRIGLYMLEAGLAGAVLGATSPSQSSAGTQQGL